jgi:uncharacterized protein YndB with AHSA1/START domain
MAGAVMARVDASRTLLASRQDVWKLLAEPHHLSDWWPGYRAVRPDRRGLAEGARWTVVRSLEPGLFRSAESEGVIVLRRVEPNHALGWHDVQQDFEAAVELADEGELTAARLMVEAAWWRLRVEGLSGRPGQALARLHDLCQTAVAL